MPRIRTPVFAGTFYPEQPKRLESFLTTSFQTISNDNTIASPRGLICPHAGYVYSGRTASFSFEAVKTITPKTIVILGPSHRIPFNGVSIDNATAYGTPLGNISIDNSLSETLRNHHPSIDFIEEAHIQEHSIEVELPFLQVLYQHSFKIISIVMGQQTQPLINTLAEALIEHCDSENTLIIASSDFSHFYSAEKAEKMDRRALDLITNREMESFYKENNNGKIQCCGFGPIMVTDLVMKAWSVTNCKERHYCHSGDVSGDLSSVVGYGSVVYY
jgi:MEMO1 family protein